VTGEYQEPSPLSKNGIVMIQHVEAVYENGVLRPLNPVSLSEAERDSPGYDE